MQIQMLPFPLVVCDDKLCWTKAKNMRFSVKSCCELILGVDQRQRAVWGLIWKAKLHERLKIFL